MPPRTGLAVVVKRGQHLRVTELDVIAPFNAYRCAPDKVEV